jgi:hypothetical protein
MSITVFVEPQGPGFRAATGGPLDLAAGGASPDEALASLQALVTAKLQAGGQIRALPVLDVTAVQSAARAVAANPLFEDWVRAVEEYRRDRNAVPDTD